MLKIFIGDITEHKRDGFILSMIITSVTSILAWFFILPLFENNINSIKFITIALVAINTYLAIVTMRLSVIIFEYCKKKDRDDVINRSAEKNRKAIKKLIKEKDEEPINNFKKRYGSS